VAIYVTSTAAGHRAGLDAAHAASATPYDGQQRNKAPFRAGGGPDYLHSVTFVDGGQAPYRPGDALEISSTSER
jgi:hypothetical protein